MQRAILTLAGLMLLVMVPMRSGYSSEPPVAVASIGPLHALLAHVTRGISSPDVLLPPGAAPHHYSLRPSDSVRLEKAAIIFWVGSALEGSLVNPIRALGSQSVSVALMDADDMNLLDRRKGGVMDYLHPADNISADPDPHIWLDPDVASAAMYVMADALATIDPARASLYAENARYGQQSLKEMTAAISIYLKPIRNRPYVVFHDAYQYFEHRFDLKPAAIVSVGSDRPPGARRIAEIRELLLKNSAACLFVEPQFTSKLVDTLREGTETKIAVLDPLGIETSSSLAGYENMIWGLARVMAECLE